MKLLMNELDLEKSFDRLKFAFNESEKKVNNKEEYPFALVEGYINLSEAVRRHLNECEDKTEPKYENDADDLKGVL